MKKLLKVLLGIIIVIVVLAGTAAAVIAIRGIPHYEPQKVEVKVEITPQRVEQGLKLATHLCLACHVPLNGVQMSGRELNDVPEEFGTAYSSNITKDPDHGIGKWTDGELIYFLRTGVKPNGDFAPPWMPKFAHMSEEDLFSIISYLRSDHPTVQPSTAVSVKCEPSFLTKFLCQFAFKPLAYPKEEIKTPDTTDLAVYGHYLVAGRYDCYPCHSANFKTININEPDKTPGFLGGGNTLMDNERRKIHSANITTDQETGIGSWTFEQFSDALRYGKKGETGLRYPMMPYTRLDDTEVKAIWAYLQTVSKIKNKVDRTLF
ncbi:MAG: c-type cytochrome [Bacteroidia bacterium]